MEAWNRIVKFDQKDTSQEIYVLGPRLSAYEMLKTGFSLP